MQRFHLLILIGASLASLRVSAEERTFVPGVAVRTAADCLERTHLTHKPIDESMSSRWFRVFLDRLDPKRMYFLQADEDEFRLPEKRLGELAKAGGFRFPRRVYQRYETRVTEAIAHAEHWLSRPHDYSVNEEFPIHFGRYASDTTELRERWRLRIKFELLVEKVHGVSAEKAEAQLRSRYQRITRDAREMTDERLCEIFVSSLAECYDPHLAYYCPTRLASLNVGLVVPYTLGLSFRRTGGEWAIRSIDPSLSANPGIESQLIGWHLLAIRRMSGPVYDVVEMPPQSLDHLISSCGEPFEKDAEVILELMDPVTFSRQSIRWPRLRAW